MCALGERPTAARAVLAGCLAVLAGLCAAAAPTPAPAAQGGDALVARLNALRSDHGLPRVAVSAARNQGCRAHAAYLARTGALVHAEDPAASGYSVAGDLAGRGSALATGRSGTLADPWADAPMHRSMLLDPGAAAYGGAELDDDAGRAWLCLGPDAGAGRLPAPAEERFWSHPGDGGAAPAAQQAQELPFTPQTRLGIPAEATTGPNLLVFWRGPEGTERRPLAATLLGDDGSRPEARVLATRDAGYGAPTAGYVVPVLPLRAGVRYAVAVTWEDPAGGRAPIRQAFGFAATDGAPVAPSTAAPSGGGGGEAAPAARTRDAALPRPASRADTAGRAALRVVPRRRGRDLVLRYRARGAAVAAVARVRFRAGRLRAAARFTTAASGRVVLPRACATRRAGRLHIAVRVAGRAPLRLQRVARCR